MGAVTPYGNGVDIFWDNLQRGKHAFSPIKLFATGNQRTKVAAEVAELPVLELHRLNEKTLSRADLLALAAVQEALEHAGILDKAQMGTMCREKMGVVVGTAAGGILGLETFFRNQFHGRPTDYPQGLLSSFCLSAIATNIAREFDIKGPRLTIATVCSSSGLALAAAGELLERDDLDRVIVVGTETICEVTHAGFNALRSVAPERCQPFDLNRRGLILGEGAGAVVLERSSSANERNVPPLACFRGYGMCTDLHHFTAPEPEGNAVARTIRLALREARMEPEDIEYLSVHGTGTPLNDIAETRGIKKVYGSHARELPVSSIKSMIGHQLGGASIMQTIASVLAMRHGIVPPTANLETPDPECDLDYVSAGARKIRVRAVMSNAFAFGGSNISLVYSSTSDERSRLASHMPEKAHVPVITGIGLVSPLGVGSEYFVSNLAAGKSGIKVLSPMGEEWSGVSGGLVDISTVREKIPPSTRRRLNRQASFLFLSLREALEDANIAPHEGGFDAMIYGSAFGCSGNVHRFYTQILKDGPKFCSPQEFNMSVTNAPPSLVAKELGLDAPIWVFSADETSWDISLHWAAGLIRRGKAGRVIVNAAEELSDAILAIHSSLGWTGPDFKKPHFLGEGAVSMVVESSQKAVERGARIYGRIQGFSTSQDTSCGPLDYTRDISPAVKATSQILEGMDKRNGPLLFIRNRNSPEDRREGSGWLRELWKGEAREASSFSQMGQSGLIGGLGLAAALLPEKPENAHIIVNTSARGGIEAATAIERSEHA